jgi:hypothetical protein
LESVANAHTAADLHVRPVSKTALVSRSWAPRATKEYTMRRSPQEIDSRCVPRKPVDLHGDDDALDARESMLLILITDSMHATSVTFSSKQERKVTFP